MSLNLKISEGPLVSICGSGKLLALSQTSIINGPSELFGLMEWTRPEVKLSDNRMTKVEQQAFYESREWRELRYFVLKRDGAACVICGCGASDGVKLHVDHIKPLSTHPELKLDPENLQVLCSECNLGKSNWDSTAWVGTVILTRELLHSGGTSGMGFTRAQAKVFGMKMEKGWLSKLVGKRVPRADFERFLAARSRKGKRRK